MSRDPNEPSVYDHGAPYNEGAGGECECFSCMRERKREAEAERVDNLIDYLKEQGRRIR